ncbi:MAG: nucleotidyltransferase family protein [Candidatus Aminicenantes bacterium]|nr:nucleotidyltransferase family protein [Candidatus Aminicenantes bacterium]
MLVTAIVLAAGQSRRMGRFKQLLPLDGCTVVETVVERLGSVARRDFELATVVVLGHRAGEVERRLGNRDLACVVNERFRQGMVTSVQSGVRSADPKSAGYLVCLGDQPDLNTEVVARIIHCSRSAGAGIVVPTHRGKRGHPVYICGRYRDEILALPADKGLNTVTGRHAGDTVELEVDAAEVLEDLDTPADYLRLGARFAID